MQLPALGGGPERTCQGHAPFLFAEASVASLFGMAPARPLGRAALVFSGWLAKLVDRDGVQNGRTGLLSPPVIVRATGRNSLLLRRRPRGRYVVTTAYYQSPHFIPMNSLVLSSNASNAPYVYLLLIAAFRHYGYRDDSDHYLPAHTPIKGTREPSTPLAMCSAPSDE